MECIIDSNRNKYSYFQELENILKSYPFVPLLTFTIAVYLSESCEVLRDVASRRTGLITYLAPMWQAITVKCHGFCKRNRGYCTIYVSRRPVAGYVIKRLTHVILLGFIIKKNRVSEFMSGTRFVNNMLKHIIEIHSVIWLIKLGVCGQFPNHWQTIINIALYGFHAQTGKHSIL